MSILERIQRIAKANVSWLLDKVDPPEKELEARIEELKLAITEGKECAATYGATFRRMERQVEQLTETQAKLQTQAEQALAGGDEKTARASLNEKVRLTERIAKLTPGVQQGRATYDRLREDLTSLQDQLNQAKLKLAELKSRQRAANAHKSFGEQFDKSSSISDGGAMFDRMEDQVMQTEAEADISQEMRGNYTDAELEQRSRDLQVEAELNAIRQKLGEQ